MDDNSKVIHLNNGWSHTTVCGLVLPEDRQYYYKRDPNLFGISVVTCANCKRTAAFDAYLTFMMWYCQTKEEYAVYLENCTLLSRQEQGEDLEVALAPHWAWGNRPD